MKEAIGGALTIQIIIIFLLIINSYLAFTVNYTKAFRVKNEIISIIEKNEGFTGGSGANSCENGNNACRQISDYLNDVGYNTTRFECNSGNDVGYEQKFGGYCIKVIKEGTLGNQDPNATYVGTHYSVKTFVSINIPVLDQIMPIFSNVFTIKGETKTIYSSGKDTENKG